MTNREKQKEKLTDLIIESVDGCARHWAEIISDHLLDSGNVIVTPCKVGDTVFFVDSDNRIYKVKIDEIDSYFEVCAGKYDYWSIRFDRAAKCIFSTREAAEKEIRERETP